MKGRRGYETRNEPEIEIIGATVRIMGLQLTASASRDDTANTEHVPILWGLYFRHKNTAEAEPESAWRQAQGYELRTSAESDAKTGAHHYEQGDREPVLERVKSTSS